MLQAACNRNRGDINVGKALQTEVIEEARNGPIAELYGETMFYYKTLVEKAITDGSSTNKRDRVLQSIVTHISVFKVRLENDGPTRIAPKKVKLDAKKQLIRVRVRKYLL